MCGTLIGCVVAGCELPSTKTCWQCGMRFGAVNVLALATMQRALSVVDAVNLLRFATLRV